MKDTDDHLARTRRLAVTLVGRRLATVQRLRNDESPDELRKAWGSALLRTDDGHTLLATVDEALANLLLFDLPADAAERERWIANRPVRLPIVTDDEGDPLRALVTEPIEEVAALGRAPEEDWKGAFELCGIRATLRDGGQVLIGTHLTDERAPGVWFLLPQEADPALQVTPLTGADT